MSDLAARIDRAARLSGTFTLRSGQTSTTYFDKFQFLADPVLLRDIAAGLATLIPAGTEVLAGLELGGVPVVTALSRETGLPAAFVRKQAKEYGTMRLAEGAPVQGRRVLVVEDIVTSAGQVIISAVRLRELGAHIEHAVCVVDRLQGGAQALAVQDIQLHPLLTRDDLDRA